jgi:hypothetical protein
VHGLNAEQGGGKEDSQLKDRLRFHKRVESDQMVSSTVAMSLARELLVLPKQRMRRMSTKNDT